MPSITTWSRLEPRTAAVDTAAGYAAPVHDALWMLARQWQVGEFQGEDGGTPIVANWRGRVKPMTRFHAGPISPNTQLTAGTIDADAMPVEARVERQATGRAPLTPGVAGLRLAVESGQHFLRLLRAQSTSADYTDAFRAAHVVPPLSADERARLDPDTAAFADLVAERALDGRLLRQALGDADEPRLDPALEIAAGDRAEVAAAYRAWTAWLDDLFVPGPGTRDEDAWQPDRLEYAFSLSTRLGDDEFGERTLTASQYTDGTLDWYAFDLNGEVSMGTREDEPGSLVTRTVLPAPVTFHGMPSARFWELEDARISLEQLQLGSTDLPQLLLVETLTGFGNDWFVIPIQLLVGSLVESRSLVVEDTFGVRTLILPIGQHGTVAAEGFRMFSLAMPVSEGAGTEVPVTNLFFLPATVTTLESPMVEEVVFARDELANVAWAIETRLESPLEIGVKTDHEPVETPAGVPATPGVATYRLASPVPPHWVPLIPTRVDAGRPEVRLSRGAVLNLDGQPHLVGASAQLLEVGEGTLQFREEEVPRDGIVVRRSYEAARWHDGRLFVWASNRVAPGAGDASSGLSFDRLDT